MSKNDSLNGTTLPLRKIRQRESAVPKHRYGRYQIADIIIQATIELIVNHIPYVSLFTYPIVTGSKTKPIKMLNPRITNICMTFFFALIERALPLLR